jgi:hypothetical protein
MTDWGQNGRERFLICRRGRPVGAIVSPEDLRKLEEASELRTEGLIGALGALAEFEDFDDLMQQIVADRVNTRSREVDLG